MARYRIGPFELDPRTRLLARDAVVVPLGPKVVDTLSVLVERRGELVTKQEILDAVWPDQFVEEGGISQNIYRLRRTLSAGGVHDAIRTMPGRGYSFVADVKTVDTPSHRGPQPRQLYGPVVAAAVFLTLALLGWHENRTPMAVARLSDASRQAYRLALYHLNLRSDSEHARHALWYFRQIASRDPHNAIGYAGLADAYLAIFDTRCDANRHRCRAIADLALENARRAVMVDPRSAEAHTALAMAVNEVLVDDRRAEAEFRESIALDPRYALAHHWYGNFLTVLGRYAEATTQHRIALALEPTSPSTYAWLAEDAFLSGRFADAIASAHEAAALSPLRHPTRVLLCLAYERTGHLRQARACFKALDALEAQAMTAALLARHGQRLRAARLLAAIRPAAAAAHGATEATTFAWIAMGDPSRAKAYLRLVPLPNRVERNFLARDPRWRWDAEGSRSPHWVTPV